MVYKLGVMQKVVVCRQAFRYAHKLKRDQLNTLAKELKESKVGTAGRHTDRSNPANIEDKKLTKFHNEMCKLFDLTLTPEENAAMYIPNSDRSLECWAWMDYYFNLVGDHEPNSNNEIHLEPCTIKDIWTTYIKENKHSEVGCLSAIQFGVLWKTCFR